MNVSKRNSHAQSGQVVEAVVVEEAVIVPSSKQTITSQADYCTPVVSLVTLSVDMDQGNIMLR